MDTNDSQVHYVTGKKQTWKTGTIYCFGDEVLKRQSLRVGMQASNGQRVGGGCSLQRKFKRSSPILLSGGGAGCVLHLSNL